MVARHVCYWHCASGATGNSLKSFLIAHLIYRITNLKQTIGAGLCHSEDMHLRSVSHSHKGTLQHLRGQATHHKTVVLASIETLLKAGNNDQAHHDWQQICLASTFVNV